MAYFRYLSEIDTDCLLTSFKNSLEDAGLTVLNEFSNHAQIFAEDNLNKINYQSKVKVLISWTNKSIKECSVEIRSDEPYLKKDTCCENLAIQLRSIIPPKDSLREHNSGS